MDTELTYDDCELLIESLRYSKRNVSEGKDSPYELKQRKIEHIENVASKIRSLQSKLKK